MLRYATLRYASLRYATLCYATLRYVIQLLNWTLSAGDVKDSIQHLGAPKGVFADMVKDSALESPAAGVGSSSSSTKVAVGSAIEKKKPVEKEKKRPKKQEGVKCCFYCQSKSGGLEQHPHVCADLSGDPVYICTDCHKNWDKYRKAAKQGKTLMLAGESNEENCALCSANPAHLVMCSFCPRSYCDACLSKVLTKKQLKDVKKVEDWACLHCANEKKEGGGEAMPAAAMKSEKPTKGGKKAAKSAKKNASSSSATTNGSSASSSSSSSSSSAGAVSPVPVAESVECWLRSIAAIYSSENPAAASRAGGHAAAVLLKYLLVLATSRVLKSEHTLIGFLRTAIENVIIYCGDDSFSRDLTRDITTGKLFGVLPMVSVINALPPGCRMFNRLFLSAVGPVLDYHNSSDSCSEHLDVETFVCSEGGEVVTDAVIWTGVYKAVLRIIFENHAWREPKEANKILLRIQLLTIQFLRHRSDLDDALVYALYKLLADVKAKLRRGFGDSVTKVKLYECFGRLIHYLHVCLPMIL
jgi:hypothetical protein